MSLLQKYSFENLPLDCFHSFIQLDPPAYVIPVFILSVGWKWQSHWLTLGPRPLEINDEPTIQELHIWDTAHRMVSALRKVSYFLPLSSLLLSYVSFLCFCPTHTPSVERCEIFVERTSVTMEKFLPRWLGTNQSQTISFNPWAHCFPPVTSAIQKQLQVPVKQHWDPIPEAILVLLLFSLEGGTGKILEKLPWCIISKRLLMEVWAKQPVLLEERREQKWKKGRYKKMMEKNLSEWNKITQWEEKKSENIAHAKHLKCALQKASSHLAFHFGWARKPVYFSI